MSGIQTVVEGVETKKVFLGGTVANSTWRDSLIPRLKNDYFNPQLPAGAWNDEAQVVEDAYKADADIMLYYLTPISASLYSAFEIGLDTGKRPKSVVFYFQESDGGNVFEGHALKVVKKIGQDVEKAGGTWCKTYDELVDVLNK